jgi:hypothetical protein
MSIFPTASVSADRWWARRDRDNLEEIDDRAKFYSAARAARRCDGLALVYLAAATDPAATRERLEQLNQATVA